MLKIIRF